MYLPTTAMVTSPSGLRHALDDRPPAREIGRAARRRCRRRPAPRVSRPCGVIGRAAPRRCCRRRSAWITADSRDVAEQRDLALLVLGDRPVGAAQQDVRLDADRAQLLDRVLGRLGLQLAGRLDERQQGQMDVDGVARAAARCRAGGSPRRTAGLRCRRPCRRSRTSTKSKLVVAGRGRIP